MGRLIKSPRGKMRKIVLFIVVYCFIAFSKDKQMLSSNETPVSFLEISRFFENGKVLDTVFINSKEGLNVRVAPDLSADRKCILPNRFPVKIVSVGKQETIDGIFDSWVEIVVPKFECKSEDPEYGWVFGGFLSKKKTKVITPTTEKELFANLKSCIWSPTSEGGYILDFSFDERKPYNLFLGNPSGNQHFGNYKYISANEIEVTFPDWEEQTILNSGTYEVCLSESYLSLMEKSTEKRFQYWQKNTKGVNSFVYFLNKPALYAHDYYDEDDEEGYPVLGKNFLQSIDCFEDPENTWIKCYDSAEELRYCIDIAIKYGVSAELTDYQQMYRDYWDPIMTIHQERANKEQYQ